MENALLALRELQSAARLLLVNAQLLEQFFSVQDQQVREQISELSLALHQNKRKVEECAKQVETSFHSEPYTNNQYEVSAKDPNGHYLKVDIRACYDVFENTESKTFHCRVVNSFFVGKTAIPLEPPFGQWRMEKTREFAYCVTPCHAKFVAKFLSLPRDLVLLVMDFIPEWPEQTKDQGVVIADQVGGAERWNQEIKIRWNAVVEGKSLCAHLTEAVNQKYGKLVKVRELEPRTGQWSNLAFDHAELLGRPVRSSSERSFSSKEHRREPDTVVSPLLFHEGPELCFRNTNNVIFKVRLGSAEARSTISEKQKIMPDVLVTWDQYTFVPTSVGIMFGGRKSNLFTFGQSLYKTMTNREWQSM